MNLISSQINKTKNRGVTLVEVMVVTGLISIIFVSLYASISSGFALINLGRENLRANQIALEKMETIRLYTWDQVSSNGFIAASFTDSFFPAAITNSILSTIPGSQTNGGLTFYGTVQILPANVSAGYSNLMKQITVTVQWTNSGIPRKREMTTLVSQYGIQNYIY